MQTDAAYDVVILGGGINGCATAYWLKSSGQFDGSVVVVERDPSYENAPSAKATGGIRQQFSTPENVRIGLFGAEFVHAVEDHLSVNGEPTGVLFREQGYLLLGRSDQLSVMEDSHRVQKDCGADIVQLGAPELTAQFPWLEVGELAGGFFGRTNEGWVDPYTLLQAFRNKARSLGVEFVTDEALRIVAEGRRASAVELAKHGQVRAGIVVNTAGASGARRLAQTIGVDLPIESRQRCTFVFECREEGMGGAPLTVTPDGVAFRPEGSRFLTSVTPPPERDPETFEHDIDHGLFDDIIWPSLARYIPVFEAIKVVGGWSCHYDFNLLDENLIVGRLGDYENVYLAAGLSGHGMQQAPAVGRALSELICHGEYRSLDLGRFEFGRVLSGEGIHENNCW